MDRVPKPELRVHGRWGSVSQCETVGDTESSQRILRLTIPLHLEVDSSVKQWKAVLVGSSGSIHAAAASTSGPSVDLSVNISFKVVRNEPLRESDWPRAEVRVTSTYLRREMSTKLAVVLPPGSVAERLLAVHATLDIPPVQALLLGLRGAGKSSLIDASFSMCAQVCIRMASTGHTSTFEQYPLAAQTGGRVTGPKQVSLTLCDMWGTEDAPTIWSAVMGKLEEGRSESVALDRNFRPSRAGLSRGVSASAALVVLRAEQAAAEDVSRYVEIISALHELGVEVLMALTVLNEHARTTATAQKDAAARRFSVAVPNVFVIDLLCQEIGGELELLNMLLLTRDAGKRRMKQK